MSKGRAPAPPPPPRDEAAADELALPAVAPVDAPPPAERCVALTRVLYGVDAATTVAYEPGAAIPDEHAGGMVEGVHYRRE